MAAQKLSLVAEHLHSTPNGLSIISQQNPDDIAITLAIRTPMCKAVRGGLKDTTLDEIVFKLLEQVRARSDIEPQLVNDICLGNVRDGKASYYIRAASLGAGYPNTTCASSTGRFCSFGFTALQHIANEIKSDTIDIGIAIGAESITESNERLSRPFAKDILDHSDDAKDCMLPMAENVAKDFNISRRQQYEYGAESNRRAELAQKSGWFDDEIVPITVQKDGEKITLSRDEIRYGTTYEKIAKLKPTFPDCGDTVNAGNSSQLTDGAAAMLLMKRSKALELKQPIIAKYVGTALAGLPPRIMGIGPVLAIP